MATDAVSDYLYTPSTPTLQVLARKASDEIREDFARAKETPVSKLGYTPGCVEITAEYYRSHHKAAPTAKPMNYQEIESYYKPEIFALIKGPIWIREKHSAVVIPLLGNPKALFRNRQGDTREIRWEAGSIHHFGGDISLDLNEEAKVTFIFLLFKMS